MDIENKLTEREVVVLKHSEKLESFQGSILQKLNNSLSKPLSRGSEICWGGRIREFMISV
jgi:hypothetical protein